MRGFGHRTGHAEVENGFCGAGSYFGEAAPSRISGPDGLLTVKTVEHEINVHIRLVGGPMLSKIDQKPLPIGWQAILLKVPDRK